MSDGHVLLGMCLRDNIHIKEDSPKTGEETLSGSIETNNKLLPPNRSLINSHQLSTQIMVVSASNKQYAVYSSGR